MAVTGMVTAPLPQLKVMTPPRVAAGLELAEAAFPWLPVPTTVVGLETSAGWPLAGTPALHEPLGFPALVMVSRVRRGGSGVRRARAPLSACATLAARVPPGLA